MTLRIFCSEGTAAGIRPLVARVLGARPFEIATPGAHGDFDVAFMSRDVIGNSIKHHIEPSTQRFHDALREAPSLRWLQIHSAGANGRIYRDLQERGVVITTASGAMARPVAQSALAGILALARKLPLLAEQQRHRQWKSLVGSPPADLDGQTAVILGWGPIGRALARWLQAIGLEVVVVRNTALPAGDHPTVTFAQLREVAPRADWLVIACPLSDRTHGLVDAGVFQSMPQGAHVVNVGRGEIVIEAELMRALATGHLAGAYLDVFEHEPLDPASTLWSLPNVIVSPHSAGHSSGNDARRVEIFLENLGAWVGERALRNVLEKVA